jgi:hypothetical protein
VSGQAVVGGEACVTLGGHDHDLASRRQNDPHHRDTDIEVRARLVEQEGLGICISSS